MIFGSKNTKIILSVDLETHVCDVLFSILGFDVRGLGVWVGLIK